MEKNYVSRVLKTQYYFNLVKKEYGVIKNVNDERSLEDLVKKFRELCATQIESWTKEWGVA